MTEYKLIKELPWLEVGEIINNSFSFSLSYLKETWWIEEIKEQKSIYELKDWDEYYYIYDKIQKLIIEDNLNKKLYEKDLEQWNAFLTRQEAEQELNKRKALSKIRK